MPRTRSVRRVLREPYAPPRACADLQRGHRRGARPPGPRAARRHPGAAAERRGDDPRRPRRRGAACARAIRAARVRDHPAPRCRGLFDAPVLAARAASRRRARSAGASPSALGEPRPAGGSWPPTARTWSSRPIRARPRCSAPLRCRGATSASRWCRRSPISRRCATGPIRGCDLHLVIHPESAAEIRADRRCATRGSSASAASRRPRSSRPSTRTRPAAALGLARGRSGRGRSPAAAGASATCRAQSPRRSTPGPTCTRSRCAGATPGAQAALEARPSRGEPTCHGHGLHRPDGRRAGRGRRARALHRRAHRPRGPGPRRAGHLVRVGRRPHPRSTTAPTRASASPTW